MSGGLKGVVIQDLIPAKIMGGGGINHNISLLPILVPTALNSTDLLSTIQSVQAAVRGM